MIFIAGQTNICLVGNWTKQLDISFGLTLFIYNRIYWEQEWRYPRPARGGENPAGGARGWKCQGETRYFSSSKPGGIEHIQFCTQHLIWLPGDLFSALNTGTWQLIASERESDQMGRQTVCIQELHLQLKEDKVL